MNKDELDAYGKLAEQISTLVRYGASNRQKGTIALPCPYFYDWGTSTLEGLARAAVSLGILGSDEDHYGHYGYILDHSEVYAHAINLAEQGPLFDEMLGSMIYYAQEHGGGFRAYPPEHSFPVIAEFDALFRSLVTIGYATKAGLEYCWTLKAVKAMSLARIWPLGSEPDAYFRRTGRW